MPKKEENNGRKKKHGHGIKKWEKLKGFEPISAYPGMSRKQIFQKASELGFNSVRFWIHAKETDEQINFIREMAEEADAFGLTISPVLAFSYNYFNLKNKEKAFVDAKKYTQQVIGAFANDKRIILWDIWNEPIMHDTPEMYEQMDWIEAAVEWTCYKCFSGMLDLNFPISR